MAQHSLDRRAHATQAMHTAIETRRQAGCDQKSPICIYDLCDALSVTVRFNDINMEGMYQRGSRPRIHLSALRPLVRRNFNCAHELGHHVFGHGSTIDELRENSQTPPWEDPQEFLANAFAGFILMPTLGLRRAFSVRGWKPHTATPAQLWIIACDFGVGYTTLLTHLSMSVGLISLTRSRELQRVTPASIRTDIIGQMTKSPLIVVDSHRQAQTVDAEVNSLLLFPAGSESSGDGLKHERDLEAGRLFRAVRPGIHQVRALDSDRAMFARIMAQEYVGLANYRHLEVDADEKANERDSDRTPSDL